MSNTKDKLSLIKLFTFTKQSLITATLILIFSIIERLANIGIDTEDNIKIFSVWCALLIFLYVIYVIIVLCSYHIFPKNKLKDDKIGVLFFIDTCDNKEDYKAIKEKLVDEFRKLSENNPYSDKKLSPIILSMKNVEVLKDKIYDRKEEEKLLKKTNCIFGVFFKAINEGRESLNYELNINAAITHPSMNTLTRKIFANNFSLILREVGVNKLNKNNELKDLNLIASKLYYIC